MSLVEKIAPLVEAIKPLVKYWYIDDNGDYVYDDYDYEPDYWEYDDYDYYDPYENDNDFYWDDLYVGLPEYDTNDLDEDAGVVDWVEYYQYIFDLAFIAIPWTIIAILCIGWNVWFNWAWNELWASGNWWLVLNTAYILL